MTNALAYHEVSLGWIFAKPFKIKRQNNIGGGGGLYLGKFNLKCYYLIHDKVPHIINGDCIPSNQILID
jgi:hypothetical protein